MYDPVIGRFTGVGPISDQFAWVSTYNYAENEPIANIDLHGLQKLSFRELLGSGLDAIGLDGNTVRNGPTSQDRANSISDTRSYLKDLGDRLKPLADGLSSLVPGGSILNPNSTKGDVAFDIGLEAAATIIPGSKFADEGGEILYRAVSQAELDDIAENGLRIGSNGYEFGKLFTDTYESAVEFAKDLARFSTDGVGNHIIKVRIPDDVMRTATRFEADGRQAIDIPAEQLSKIKEITTLTSNPIK